MWSCRCCLLEVVDCRRKWTARAILSITPSSLQEKKQLLLSSPIIAVLCTTRELSPIASSDLHFDKLVITLWTFLYCWCIYVCQYIFTHIMTLLSLNYRAYISGTSIIDIFMFVNISSLIMTLYTLFSIRYE